ncbi:RagB/SusD family nutrient uptake outer membrane protein [Pseudoflavitalea sp. G-6-1-2]|uniref:RagB/SusD family nutrient uptake outer membrane protein n=1 Tax=Pseudoflavitalea sp. G-6-1-2 TaxID=2728841 RepID=UPI00146E00C4|nr:RagB/SusD family nutrient uptake outer membrane protein [Pseudoflavitalea sp. G-6-1-2]NML21792.1 RagB/SusD family nutrient uptake outer membrane protein [Pseudoflavitalea sp. G-6-1-2]
MKRYSIIITVILLLITSIAETGCEKMLDESPKSSISLGKLDPGVLEQTLIGIYEPLTRSRGRLWESTIGLGFELMAEYADAGGSSQQSWSNYNNLMNSNTALNQPWTTLYESIGRANSLIVTLDEDKALTEDLRNRAYGEAYFVRALCFYFAVRTFGKFPMRLKPILNARDVSLSSSDIPVIYDQIIKDLKFAENVLPKTVPAANAGRATAGAAKTMLADVYLTMKDYPNARIKSKEVMDSKADYGYDLEASLATVYSPTLPTNKEDVFSLKFSQIINGGNFMASYWADSKAKQAGYSISGNKFGGVTSNAPLIKNWDPNDLRKKFSLYNTYLINGVVTNAELDTDYDLRMGKFKDPNAPIDTGNGNDLYMYRYPDVLLIFAEAENKVNGPTAAAYDAINQVRRRAYGLPVNTPSNVSDLSGLDQTQFDDMVFRERGYEFIGEAKRWFDLVRTDRVNSILTEVRANILHPNRKPTPTRTTFLIPDVEVANNPAAGK